VKIGAVILAAGAGTRLGGVAKALLTDKDGRTYLARIVATAREVGVERPIVVVGAPFAAEVGREAGRLGAVVVVNQDPSRGMASSVALGFGALDVAGTTKDIAGTTRDIADIGRREDSSYPVRPDDMRVEAAWLWPVDHPHVQASTLRGLSSALTQHDAARPVYQGRGGHPPLIARSLFERLATCANIDGGARSVLGAADTIDVPVDDPGCVRDVDTPADLEAV